MPRTAAPYTTLNPNALASGTATSIDIANGMTVPASEPERTVLIVTNTDTSAHTVTVKAGDPILGLGQWPDLAFSVPASSTRYLGPFESSRVQQRDRSMNIDFQAGHVGTITALLLPRGV